MPRQELTELHERQDFLEPLLLQKQADVRLAPPRGRRGAGSDSTMMRFRLGRCARAKLGNSLSPH
jgi:hypothetical protein